MNKISFKKLIIFETYIVTAMILMLTSCATIYSGTTQNISVEAVDIANFKTLEDVSCLITNINGNNYYISKNPGMVTIPKVGGILKIKCIKDQYVQKNFDVQNDFTFMTFGNIPIWPGFIVDTLSDSMYKYPSYITIFMDKIS